MKLTERWAAWCLPRRLLIDDLQRVHEENAELRDARVEDAKELQHLRKTNTDYAGAVTKLQHQRDTAQTVNQRLAVQLSKEKQRGDAAVADRASIAADMDALYGVES